MIIKRIIQIIFISTAAFSQNRVLILDGDGDFVRIGIPVISSASFTIEA